MPIDGILCLIASTNIIKLPKFYHLDSVNVDLM